ncbi:hypothetical protein ABZ639_02510 [Saccharomonospora sp. NPDC006951]
MSERPVPGKGTFNSECYTRGCVNTEATGVSAWDDGAGQDRYRCGECLDALAVLVPSLPNSAWSAGLVDSAAFTAFTRRITGWDRARLHEEAAPLLRHEQRAYRAFAGLADRVGLDQARDAVATIVERPDVVYPAVISDFWVRYRTRSTESTVD